MATPLSASRLVAVLKAEGVRVVEHRSWRTNNRNRVGAWGPVHGVMIHHTVTSGTNSSVELCYNGRSDLPGPLCHGVIAKDGTVHLVGNGRANHAGSGDDDVLRAVIAEAALPADNEANTDGNRHFYGFECINLGNGRDPWPQAQVDAIVRASAAICRAHGWGKRGKTSVIGHLEWQPGKIDPRPSPGGGDVRMSALRDRVAERLRHGPGWNPEEEDDMPLNRQDARTVWLTDGIIRNPIASSSNEYIAPATGLRNIEIVVRRLERKIDAQTAVIQTMAQALAAGGPVEAESLMDQIRQAIETATTRPEPADAE